MVNVARLQTRLSRYGGASVFYVGILIIAGINISSVHFSAGFSRLEASVRKTALRRGGPKALFARGQFGSSGITVSARRFFALRSNFETVGQTGAELASSSPTVNATLTPYWEVEIKNGRDNKLYADVAVDSIGGPPRDPRTKELELGPDVSQRQIHVNGKARTVVRSYHRRRGIEPHSTATLLALWADDDSADFFEFKVEFSLGVEPFGDCTGCDDASRIVRAAYIEYLGREPDSGGMATYKRQLASNRTAEAVRADIWDSAEGEAYRRRLERGELDYAQHPLPAEPKALLGSSWPPPGTLLTGAVLGGRHERSFWHLIVAPPAEETFHTAAHGLQFEVESKEDAVALTSIRTSGLAPHLRGSASGTSHLRLFALSTGLDDAEATVASDWRLLGQYNGPVPAAPYMATMLLDKPYHLGPRERVKLSLHADHPLGVSVTVPSISVLAADLRKRSRVVVGGVWRQIASLLLPEWLSLALSPSTPGVVQDEYIIVSPGQRLGASPFEGVRPATSAGFVGMLQYVAAPRDDVSPDDSPLLRVSSDAVVQSVQSHNPETEQEAECFG